MDQPESLICHAQPTTCFHFYLSVCFQVFLCSSNQFLKLYFLQHTRNYKVYIFAFDFFDILSVFWFIYYVLSIFSPSLVRLFRWHCFIASSNLVAFVICFGNFNLLQREAVAEIFYEKHFGELVDAIASSCPPNGDGQSSFNTLSLDGGSMNQYRMKPEILLNICDLLSFCVMHHPHRIK